MDVSFQHVQPGDLITSDMFNLLLDEFQKLRDRVTVLEGSPSVGDVAILRLVPDSGIVRAGDTLTVVGYGFGLSLGAARAFVDNVEVPQFMPGSNDQQLIFAVPDSTPVSPPIPPFGRPAPLVVRGPKGTARREITLLPPNVVPPGGIGVRLTFKQATPATITVGQPAQFRFTASSLVSVPITVTPSVAFPGVANPAPWLATAAFVGPDGTTPLPGGRFDLRAGELDREFVLRLQSVPSVPNGTAVNYVVNVASADAAPVTGTSGVQTFTVGQAQVPTDPNIEVAITNVLPPNAASGGTITLAPNATALVSLTATFKAAGTYLIGDPVLTGTGWTATRTSLAKIPVAASPLPITAGLTYTVKAGAAVTDGSVSFPLQREAAPGGAVGPTKGFLLKSG